MSQVGVRQARAELPTLLDAVAAGEPVTITRHGRPVAALLPAEAVEVWQAHVRERAERGEREAAETAAGERLPAGRTPVCPHCRSSYLSVLYTGVLVAALVNTADPGAGVQAVTVEADTAELRPLDEVRCASCWEPLGDRPRSHGYPAHQAAAAIADEARWPAPAGWELGDALSVDETRTGAARIVTAHDLARGVLVRVTRWEYLTGVLDSDRDQMRADAGDDRG